MIFCKLVGFPSKRALMSFSLILRCHALLQASGTKKLCTCECLHAHVSAWAYTQTYLKPASQTNLIYNMRWCKSFYCTITSSQSLFSYDSSRTPSCLNTLYSKFLSFEPILFIKSTLVLGNFIIFELFLSFAIKGYQKTHYLFVILKILK